MANKTLLQFGEGGIATIHSSGVVDIRVIDEQRTLTCRMSVGELARIAKIVFMNVRNDVSNDQRDRDNADDVNGKLMNFVQGWGD